LSLTSVLLALLVFTLLVAVHEIGHFVAARLAGIDVLEFAIGLGPKIFSVKSKKTGTLYSVRVIPLGGFCKMASEAEQEADESGKKPRTANTFESKKVRARIGVILAGPVMNFVLAFVIIFSLAAFREMPTSIISNVEAGLPAEAADIRIGDELISINGIEIHSMQDVSRTLAETQGEAITLIINRSGEELSFNIEPYFSEEQSRYMVGIAAMKPGLLTANPHNLPRATFGETIAFSGRNMVLNVMYMAIGLGQIATGNISFGEMSGPIGIVEIIGDAYQAGAQISPSSALFNIAGLAALISVNLGFINLLPIPALDGGRLIFLILEGIRRKRISPEREAIVHFTGFVALMVLAAFIAFNDIIKIIR